MITMTVHCNYGSADCQKIDIDVGQFLSVPSVYYNLKQIQLLPIPPCVKIIKFISYVIATFKIYSSYKWCTLRTI